jgi:hypothetical protein
MNKRKIIHKKHKQDVRTIHIGGFEQEKKELKMKEI